MSIKEGNFVTELWFFLEKTINTFYLMLQVSKVGDDDDDEEVDHGDRAQDDHRQQEEHGKASTYPIPEREISQKLQDDHTFVTTPCQMLGRDLQS